MDDNLTLRASSPFKVKSNSCSFQPLPIYPAPVDRQPQTAESSGGGYAAHAAVAGISPTITLMVRRTRR
jgi:hypothetical protein